MASAKWIGTGANSRLTASYPMRSALIARTIALVKPASSTRSSSRVMSLQASQGLGFPTAALRYGQTGCSLLELGRKVPSRPPPRLPPDCCRRRHAKPHRRSSATHPAVNRCQKPRRQIRRESLAIPCRPPRPARILDWKSGRMGIRSQFIAVEICSRTSRDARRSPCGAATGGTQQSRCEQQTSRSWRPLCPITMLRLKG
jgi:hypothetical protein